ncbi:sterol-sensing domain of SREBP cleavage-activation-domain-containing protein [Cadophora sp. MPI-SDFR-AT-0126]|nr:sterol-sensing domain of SREBP cleavage-activation-domain-containing protein [Leotiomycetes sp. MPI-SDFR-AT-0126]
MIWYLLYPFRGTTEPPQLDNKHPLRAAFTRYGNYSARHPVITLLISVATAAILIYPFPFLYTNNFTSGASNLPHHVWTSAQPFEGIPTTRPDVVMRSIWVHGSYMKALEPNVLLRALEIQDELLGPTVNFDPRKPQEERLTINATASLTPDMRDVFHAVNGVSDSSWFFHSPLQYWSCDEANIAEDKDIISTVNKRSRQSTSVNVTLRHSIVFSGKRFEDHRLVAADALVITLVHMLDSPVGRQWEQKAQALARRRTDKWRLYPEDGRPATNTLYEFRFQPLSFQDDLFLGVIYSLIVIYFLISLSKLRALKSRLGLIVAVMAQIAVSIMSSFTICAIFKIDLSKIPREAYPLVILAVGLENIFRLINAVIVTPSSNSTASRIGEALGQTGHVALAGVSQNLFILWMLSKYVSPQICAFCTFAAIALSFDFFYLLTFFTAVLSVDVRRTELSDSLNRVATLSRPSTPQQQPKQTWMDAMLRGESAFSTRIAGTIVMTGFILIAQWHFFDNESIGQTALRFVHLLKSQPQPPRSTQSALLSVDIHQARTPTAWLRMQDHETAQEVIKVVKPNANSYIARVYDPLIFVLNGSDRTPTQFGVRPFLPAAYDFARNQFGVFIITVIVIVAAVSILMNYLLWDELPENDGDNRPDDEPLLSVKTLNNGHSLDIVLLTASRDGIIASVGLDRLIRIWDVRRGVMSYIVQDFESHVDPFPVLAVAIDGDSNWLALLSGNDRVFLWNIPERRWGPSMEVVVNGRKPVAFCFGYDSTEFINPLLVIRSNGRMTELHVESNESIEVLICRSPLVCVRQHFEKPIATSPNPPARVVTSSRKGCVHIASQLESGWVSDSVDIPCPPGDQAITSVLPLPALSSFLAVRTRSVDLVDIVTHKITHTFPTSPMKPDSLRCFHSTRRRPQCGSVGLASLAIAYTNAETGNVILQSYLPERDGDTICFRDPYTPGSKTCCLWRETVEQRYEIENPGEWDALKVGYLVGIRKREPPSTKAKSSIIANTGLRRRGAILPPPLAKGSDISKADDDVWEVWSISARGDRTTTPLCGYAENDNLLVPGLGPIRKLGRNSIVVGLGNVIKVISVGNDKLDGGESSADDALFVGMASAKTSRRKKTSMGTKKSH